MGCLKSLIRKIIFIALLIAFFALGGFAFVKDQINKYQNPTRSDFVEQEKNYGDFSSVPSDYQLNRSFNFFGYKKINAKYLPTGQKITIFDLKNDEKITPNDFATKEIDKKIVNLLDTAKDSFVTLENFEITARGTYQAKGKAIPFVKFSAKVKNVPFKTVVGILAGYSTNNYSKKGKDLGKSTKLILTIVDTKAYNPTIPSGFINAIKF